MKKSYLLMATLLILSVGLRAEEENKDTPTVADTKVNTTDSVVATLPWSDSTDAAVSRTSMASDWTTDSAFATLKSKDHVRRKEAGRYLAAQGEMIVGKLRPYLHSKDDYEKRGALGVAAAMGAKSQPLLLDIENALVDPVSGISSNGIAALLNLKGVSEKTIDIMVSAIFANDVISVSNAAMAINKYKRWSPKISKRLLCLLGWGDKEYLLNVVWAWAGHLDECEQAQTLMKKYLVSADSYLGVGIIAAFMVSGIADDEICKETGQLFLEGSEINQKWLIEQIEAGIKKNPKFEASLENQATSSPGIKKILEAIHAK